MSDRQAGTVKWFSQSKGYGFITPDGSEKDVFVHYSVIQGEGYRNLVEGQRVSFVVEDSPKGPQAADVTDLGMEETEVMEQDVVETAVDTDMDTDADMDADTDMDANTDTEDEDNPSVLPGESLSGDNYV